MKTVERISVSLTPDMMDTLKEAVNSGEYTSASEVIREALRAWKVKWKVETAQVEELRRLFQEGIDSGPSIDAELVFSRLHAKYSAMVDAK